MKWLFFDVGNVLLDETPWLATYHEGAFEALRAHDPLLSKYDFDHELRIGRSRSDMTPVQHLFHRFIADQVRSVKLRKVYYQSAVETYYDLSVPTEGVVDVLHGCRRDYRLGIIANQLPPIRNWMARFHLDSYFDEVIYDFEVGWGKPDRRIFQCALDRTGCASEDAVMIGDRLDNDMSPALTMGMRTVRVRATGDFIRFEPSGEDDTPHTTISSLRDLPSALLQLAD